MFNLPVNLNTPGMRKKIAEDILRDIELYAQRTYDGGHRNHLGASLIGHDCARYLYLVFRHVHHKKHEGRMQRLFRRGHLEEARFLEYLRGIGFQVWDVAEDGSQHRIKACHGHFGGSLDGVNRPPLQYGIDEPLLCEFKTHKDDGEFANLLKKGVKLIIPKHYDQMCVYGKHYGFRNALYMSVNKNTDELHIEIVELDWNRAVELEVRASKIIFAQFPPAKIANTEAFHICKMCDMKDHCHNGAKAEKNCRSCRYAAAVQDGQWHCNRFNGVIPEDFIPKGCDAWSPVI